MIMRRGQAFETMMLVISVIVALAILAVLMGILQPGIITPGNSPATIMHDGLREISTKGYGITVAKQATFDKGTIILKNDVRGSDLPLTPNDIGFYADSSSSGFVSTSCGTGTSTSALAVTGSGSSGGTQIQVCSKIQAYIAVCGDSSVNKYCIAIARQPDKATTQCKTSCGLS